MTVAALMAAVALTVPAPSPMPVVRHKGCPAEPMWACYYPGGDVYDAGAGPFVRRAELGHAVDHLDLTPGEREAVRRRSDWGAWRPEAFADLYAGCSAGLDPTAPWVREQRIYRVGVRARRVVGLCRLVARAALPGERKA